jgi:hypothetical protein
MVNKLSGFLFLTSKFMSVSFMKIFIIFNNKPAMFYILVAVDAYGPAVWEFHF